MSKLIVAGCSFSDDIETENGKYTNQTCWGKELAQLLGREYVHQGAGCGSNYRMWRVITTGILEGSITNKDLVCVQYTNNDRKEFWSDTEHKEDPKKSSYERWHKGGSLIRFKDGAWTWHGQYPNERKFFFQYETHFCEPTYNDHMFRVYNQMFQCLLKEYCIPTIFCYTRYKYFNNLIPLIDPFKAWAFRENGDNIKNQDFWLSHDDGEHLNDLGHKDFALQMYNHLQPLTLKF